MTTRLPYLVTALAIVALAPGCSHVIKGEKDVYDVQQRHPILVDADTATMTIPVAQGMAGLTPQNIAEIKAFSATYRARGHGTLTIGVPLGGGNADSARRIAADIQRVVSESGIEAESYMAQNYNVSAEEAAPPIVLSYQRFVASVGPCGDWSQNYGKSIRNNPVPDFGCATQNNLAASIEDPHDLVEPRAMGASDAERRAVVFDTYRKGQTTMTPRGESEKANASEVSK